MLALQARSASGLPGNESPGERRAKITAAPSWPQGDEGNGEAGDEAAVMSWGREEAAPSCPTAPAAPGAAPSLPA